MSDIELETETELTRVIEQTMRAHGVVELLNVIICLCDTLHAEHPLDGWQDAGDEIANAADNIADLDFDRREAVGEDSCQD